MTRVLLSVAIALAALLALSGGALAQSGPEFRMGFKNVAAQIPDIVGQPVEEEHYGPNGDSLQQTTTGLMVWRKADNWTAFTNGALTWVNGPEGLKVRSNDMRFTWEREDPAAPPPPPAPAAPPAPQTYSPTIKPVDLESGGPGLVVQRLMGELDSDWGQIWGWRPGRPTTVYLFIDGYHMVSGMPAIIGRGLSVDERKNYQANVVAFISDDAQTGGWAIVMNIGNGMGTPDWEATTKATLARQYSYVMQREVAGFAPPDWFREGLVRVASESKVPNDPVLKGEMAWVYDLKKRNALPTVRRLQQDWGGFVAIGANYMAAANGYSFTAVRVLADKVGMGGLLEVERRTARGEAFESALRGVAGYSLEQVDDEVMKRL